MSNENTAPSMDYNEHERTYEGFINFSKVGTVAVINVVLCLILFAFGGGAATFFGWILLIATVVAAGIGMALGASGWIPSAAVMGLTILAAILTV
ncbi:aa3 type cytochrome c oxidase subunit IV [Roseibium hamelinense]|uniref:Aa3 type cytochrome c oxidase subunit IV n=1 Tax=Roseibium hamelinense TaxID=150831 RepID=A0A562SM75_9HYPH|nr:aa3-type cytochrome c oxidase subunit IV [Roseibium hamelinense]MTI45034.1 aa3-type cytochrome c oxidase subunit IV [Roseibium hamelinense]TWI82298.1 aa3 type cytochrome c oxidase subunit IV [Roseibium hamelinense]